MIWELFCKLMPHKRLIDVRKNILEKEIKLNFFFSAEKKTAETTNVEKTDN